MKDVQALEFWAKALSGRYPNSLKRLEFAGVGRLGEGRVDFANGITAVVGGNGVGKSTLMLTALRALGPLSDSRHARLYKQSEGAAIGALLSYEAGGKAREVETRVSKDGLTLDPQDAAIPPYEWIDPSTLATAFRAHILDDKDFETNLEGVDPQKYDDRDRGAISYIVGREYSRVEVFEIEDYGDVATFPYFRVEVDGVVYDSVDMGLGELSLFLVYWKLRALPKGTIVLIEEPETHVSPRAQEHLMNVCARYCVQKALALLITTHSPFIVARLPRENVRLLMRSGRGVTVVAAPSQDQVARVLGEGVTYRGAMLVEDELARCLARSVLRNLAPELLEYFEIVNAVSDSGVVKGLEGLPKLKDWFSLVGVFDGDQREAQKDKSYTWPHLFLPGPLKPEAVIQNVIRTQPHEVAESVGCNGEQLQVACDAAQGMELHEWVRAVRQTLSLEPQAFVDGVVRVWLADEANRKACDELVSGLRGRAYQVKKREEIAGQKSVVATDAAAQAK